jgi:predicted Ser/Thr protein kinase
MVTDGIKLEGWRLCGHGGHGDVYKVPYNGRPVVVKVMRVSRLRRGIDKGKVKMVKQVQSFISLLI